ncbi:hypothetical protein RRG08_020195 [Elysia crispata]|uniref:Uncharacterized protein n=1 Tax=Elysia crispata TaxID=231223 RepID=A0AAE1DRQ2_9GAST|nr:hypothetical protein RRG08_020195 [Elysia crispata]
MAYNCGQKTLSPPLITWNGVQLWTEDTFSSSHYLEWRTTVDRRHFLLLSLPGMAYNCGQKTLSPPLITWNGVQLWTEDTFSSSHYLEWRTTVDRRHFLLLSLPGMAYNCGQKTLSPPLITWNGVQLWTEDTFSSSHYLEWRTTVDRRHFLLLSLPGMAYNCGQKTLSPPLITWNGEQLWTEDTFSSSHYLEWRTTVDRRHFLLLSLPGMAYNCGQKTLSPPLITWNGVQLWTEDTFSSSHYLEWRTTVDRRHFLLLSLPGMAYNCGQKTLSPPLITWNGVQLWTEDTFSSSHYLEWRTTVDRRHFLLLSLPGMAYNCGQKTLSPPLITWNGVQLWTEDTFSSSHYLEWRTTVDRRHFLLLSLPGMAYNCGQKTLSPPLITWNGVQLWTEDTFSSSHYLEWRTTVDRRHFLLLSLPGMANNCGQKTLSPPLITWNGVQLWTEDTFSSSHYLEWRTTVDRRHCREHHGVPFVDAYYVIDTRVYDFFQALFSIL